MPKFSEKEKETIRLKLLQAGREQFAQWGLKKTSVSDLTKAAGIAQGSFYLFFASKEELYFEILQEEERKLRSKIEASFAKTGQTFAQFLREALALLEDNPYIRQMYDEELMEALFRKLPEEKLKEHFTSDEDFFKPLIINAQENGWLIRKKPETIISLIRSLVLLSFQKRTIGAEHYEETIDLFIELIGQGLSGKGAEQRD
ncbi:TetR/AcrR family transcriptional regulator [Bacillus sp. HSf4]|uniref:TetR/AcrR family transcriptional regulator n=1 Tax=Bacillus sp. HSf4 TaxID=3035514 RepID=UPI0024093256|nr:TetR/AcrR family transcriptional regulator [Bacillus sp. HSf4]WFA07226.1 TetR/AcrR family transcriptional regulator [Bacillus sp. HSf4]